MHLRCKELALIDIQLSAGIRDHLRLIDTTKAFRDAAFTSLSEDNADGLDDYESIFKQLFCVAASDLATTVQQPLANLGVLFDDIMETGTLSKRTSIRSLFRRPLFKHSEDLESGNSVQPLVLGRGQLLFTVRQVSRSESSHLQSSGYGFANPANVVDSISSSIQVPPDSIASRLKRMEDYSSRENILKPGVHLACFALRPLLQRGFDILVRRDARNLLPTVQLPISRLEPMHLNLLAKMDGWTVASCCEGLRGKFLFASEAEREFVRDLYESLQKLTESIGNPFFEEARLVAQPFKERCKSSADTPGEASVIAFRTITDVHENTPISDQLHFTPLKFFITQQHTYKDTPDLEIFSRRIYREFAGLGDIARQHHQTHCPHRRSSYHNIRSLRPRTSLTLTRGRSWSRGRSVSCSAMRDNSSEKHLMPSVTITGLPIERDLKSDWRRGSSTDTVELRHLGNITEMGVGDVEEESFVEKLVALTIDERKRQR